MKLSTLIIFLSGFSSAKFQWKKQYSKGQAAKSECRVNTEIIFQIQKRIQLCENHKNQLPG